MKRQENFKNRKKKIVFIFRSCGDLTGTERVLLNWCRFIDYHKIDIIVCAYKGMFWNAYKEKVPYVKLLDFPFNNGLWGMKRFINSLKLFKRLRITKIVWMLNGMGEFNLAELLAGWIVTKGDFYISHHSFALPFEQIRPRLWFGFIPGIGFWRIKLIIKWNVAHYISKKVLVISKGVKEHLVSYWKMPKYNMCLGRRGVDTNIFFPDPEARIRLRKSLNLNKDTALFIALNRFESRKRVDRLLGAFLKLLHDNVNAYLLIVGEGKLKNYFCNRIEQNLLLKKHVEIMNFQKNVARLLQGADFLLLASDYEGEGNVNKEAMACGIVPILTDSYGPRGIKGRIFLSKRNVFSFYRKIREVLILSTEELTKIREENIKIIRETYKVDKCAAKEVSTFDVPIKQRYYYAKS